MASEDKALHQITMFDEDNDIIARYKFYKEDNAHAFATYLQTAIKSKGYKQRIRYCRLGG